MIILNEKQQAEEVLKTGIVDKKPYITIKLLVKYFCQYKHYSDNDIYNKIVEFLEVNYPRYELRRSSWNQTIKTIIEKSKNEKLYQIPGISITEEELKTIETLKDKKLERLAFTILCIAKLRNKQKQNNNSWISTDIKEVFNSSAISCNTLQKDIMINKLFTSGLINLTKNNNNLNIQATFINEKSQTVLFINDFRKLGYEYLKYKGENYTRCDDCGILIKLPKYLADKPNVKRFCNSCKKKTQEDTEDKKIQCVDCGVWFTIAKTNTRTKRCEECQTSYNRMIKTKWQREARAKPAYSF